MHVWYRYMYEYDPGAHPDGLLKYDKISTFPQQLILVAVLLSRCHAHRLCVIVAKAIVGDDGQLLSYEVMKDLYLLRLH